MLPLRCRLRRAPVQDGLQRLTRLEGEAATLRDAGNSLAEDLAKVAARVECLAAQALADGQALREEVGRLREAAEEKAQLSLKALLAVEKLKAQGAQEKAAASEELERLQGRVAELERLRAREAESASSMREELQKLEGAESKRRRLDNGALEAVQGELKLLKAEVQDGWMKALEEKLQGEQQAFGERLRGELASSAELASAAQQSSELALKSELLHRLQELGSHVRETINSTSLQVDAVTKGLVDGQRDQQSIHEELKKVRSLMLPTEVSFDLKKFDFSGFQKGSFWKSGLFALGVVHGFSLRFYPRGNENTAEGKCGLYLHSEQRGLFADFRLTLNGSVREAVGANCLDQGLGWDDFDVSNVALAKVDLLSLHRAVLTG